MHKHLTIAYPGDPGIRHPRTYEIVRAVPYAGHGWAIDTIRCVCLRGEAAASEIYPGREFPCGFFVLEIVEA